jgi:hypothetical protein
MKRFVALLAAGLLAGCAGVAVQPAPWTAVEPGWTAVQVETRAIGLGVPGGVRLASGVRFAGGVEVLSPPDARTHSLSDLKRVGEDVIMVSDWGDLFRARLGLDRQGRLRSIDQWRMHPLTDDDGRPFATKADGDAEGLAVTDDGRVLVSFERVHRLRDYGSADALRATPVPLALPDLQPGNAGFEGIAVVRGGWRVAAEGGGVWDCASAGCVAVTPPPAEPLPDSEYRITSLDRDPAGDGWFVLERLFREPADVRGRVRRMDASGALGPVLIELSLPSTVDNFEGLAAVPGRDATRLYILSDDNGSARQRTLLLAFDIRSAR